VYKIDRLLKFYLQRLQTEKMLGCCILGNYNIGSQNHAKITSLHQNYIKFTTSLQHASG